MHAADVFSCEARVVRTALHSVVRQVACCLSGFSNRWRKSWDSIAAVDQRKLNAGERRVGVQHNQAPGRNLGTITMAGEQAHPISLQSQFSQHVHVVASCGGLEHRTGLAEPLLDDRVVVRILAEHEHRPATNLCGPSVSIC